LDNQAGARSKRPGFIHPDEQEDLMTEKDFIERMRSNPRPVVMDFWASWCGPCRVIEPVVDKLGEEYAGRVDLWKINADEQPELLRSLHIYGIPTLISFHEGEQVARRTGAASAAVLSSLFESALSGKKPEQKALNLNDRFMRLGAGLALVGLAIFSGLSRAGLLVAGLGGLIMFTAVYNRCPIYRMASTWSKGLFQRDLRRS
jgi:thioredoxin 1